MQWIRFVIDFLYLYIYYIIWIGGVHLFNLTLDLYTHKISQCIAVKSLTLYLFSCGKEHNYENGYLVS